MYIKVGFRHASPVTTWSIEDKDRRGRAATRRWGWGAPRRHLTRQYTSCAWRNLRELGPLRRWHRFHFCAPRTDTLHSSALSWQVLSSYATLILNPTIHYVQYSLRTFTWSSLQRRGLLVFQCEAVNDLMGRILQNDRTLCLKSID